MLALLAASLAMFGTPSLFFAAVVLVFWALFFYGNSWARGVAYTLLFLFVIVLLLPAIGATLEGVRINQCISNLKQIGLALQGYHDAYDCFPPAYIADENGKPMHSWRVLILPYLEGKAIYDAYDFDEP